MTVDQNTDLYGVMGYPIRHSLSPIMHNAAFSEMGLNALYVAFATKDLAWCVQGIRALGIKGMSVTVPYKEDVVGLLDEVDALARKIGAVNTIVNKDGHLMGYNTDAIGALRALEENVELSQKRCILIGAGGAARAIGYILREKDIALTICNRSQERGKALADSLECPFLPWDRIEDLKGEILINTTPIGMSPDTDLCPIPESVLKEGMVVMDVIYNPMETRLLSLARSRGCFAVSGLGMFIQQGVEQFRLWTGLDAPIDVMAKAVKNSLGQSQ